MADGITKHWIASWALELEERAWLLREDALELSKQTEVPSPIVLELRQAAEGLDRAETALRALKTKP